MCRFGPIEWHHVLCGGLLLAVCQVPTQFLSVLLFSRVRKQAKKLIGQDKDSIMKEKKGHVWKQRTLEKK